MKEPLAKVLRLSGTKLDFGGFIVYGILGFELDLFQHGETSPYTADRRQYKVMIQTSDVLDNAIIPDQVFTLEDGSYTYSFSVNFIEPDHTGLSELSVNLVDQVVS